MSNTVAVMSRGGAPRPEVESRDGGPSIDAVKPVPCGSARAPEPTLRMRYEELRAHGLACDRW